MLGLQQMSETRGTLATIHDSSVAFVFDVCSPTEQQNGGKRRRRYTSSVDDIESDVL
jgi:hypothetical protein